MNYRYFSIGLVASHGMWDVNALVWQDDDTEQRQIGDLTLQQ